MSAPRPMRVMVVWCPDWPVLALGGEPDRPVAVAEHGRVAVCSAAARAAGVRRGMRLREAQRRCPGLETRAADPVREARMFEPVIAVLEGFVPAVEVVRPGLCVLAVEGPARYAGGEETLVELVRDAVAEVETDGAGTGEGVPVACGVGVADGVFAAMLAARDDRIVPPGKSSDFLADFTVSVLERPALTEVLVPLGITTLGRFAALPAERVAERFDADGVLAHRLARGLDARPLAVRRPGEDHDVTHAYEPPAEHDEQAVFAASRLAQRLHERLTATGLACVRLGVRIETAAGQVSWRLWRHDGTLSSSSVAERVRWQLDAWRSRSSQDSDELDGIALLQLIPDQLVIDTGRQLGLWPQGEMPEEVERAARRVQALLGQDPDRGGVSRLLPAGGRDPAARRVRVAWDGPVPVPRDGTWPAAVPDPEPSLVFAELRPVRLLDASGQVMGVSGRVRPTAAPAWLVPDDAADGTRSPIAGPTADHAVRGRTAAGAVRRLTANPVPDDALPDDTLPANTAPIDTLPGSTPSGSTLPIDTLPGNTPSGGAEGLAVTAWAGPWPAHERWWSGEQAQRCAYVQATTADGRAWLLVVRDGRWYLAGTYEG